MPAAGPGRGRSSPGAWRTVTAPNSSARPAKASTSAPGTGEPASWATPEAATISWLEHAAAYAYRFSQDVADPTVLVLAEEWASEDALKAHLASPGFADFAEVFAGSTEGTPEFVRFDAAGGRPLFG